MSPRTVTTYEIPSKSWCRVCPETRNIFYDDISFKSGARVISALSCEACPEPKHLRGSLSISWGCEVARPQCMSANPKPQTRPYPLAAECWFCLKKVFPKPPFLQGQIVNYKFTFQKDLRKNSNYLSGILHAFSKWKAVVKCMESWGSLNFFVRQLL